MQNNEAQVKISATQDVSQKAGQASSAIKNFSTETTKAGRDIIGAMAKAKIAFDGVMLIVNKLTSIVDNTVTAFNAQERATLQLDFAVQKANKSLGLSTSAISQTADALAGVTRYGDEAIEAFQSILVNSQVISQDEMPRATEAVLDLSEALGISLTDAANKLSRMMKEPAAAMNVLAERGFILDQVSKDYILTLEEQGRTAEAANFLLSELENRYGGIARAMGETGEAVQSRWQNAIGDFNESVGSIFSALQTNFYNKMTPLLNDLTAWIEENAPKIYGVISGLPQIAGVAFRTIGRLIERTFNFRDLGPNLRAAFDFGMEALFAIIQAVPDFFYAAFYSVQLQVEALGHNMEWLLTNSLRLWAENFINDNPIVKLINMIQEIRGKEAVSVDFVDEGTTRELMNIFGNAAELGFEIAGDNLQKRLGDITQGAFASLENTYGDILGEAAQEMVQIIDEGVAEFSAFPSGAGWTGGQGGFTPPESNDPLAGGEGSGDGPGLEDMLGFLDVFKEGLGGITGLFDKLGSAIGPLLSNIGSLAASFGPWAIVIIALIEIFNGLISVIGPAIDGVLRPLFNFLNTIGVILGRLMIPSFEALAPILDVVVNILGSFIMPSLGLLAPMLETLTGILRILMPVFIGLGIVVEIVMSPIRFLADLFTYIGQVIRHAIGVITFWTSSDNTSRPGAFSSDAFTGLEDRINRIREMGNVDPTSFTGGDWATPGSDTDWAFPGGGDGTGGPGGANATVRQPAPIYITQTFQGPIIGEGGMEEFGEMTVAAIEDYIGIGGRVVWLS